VVKIQLHMMVVHQSIDSLDPCKDSINTSQAVDTSERADSQGNTHTRSSI
jgi:hypothetical protein